MQILLKHQQHFMSQLIVEPDLKVTARNTQTITTKKESKKGAA